MPLQRPDCPDSLPQALEPLAEWVLQALPTMRGGLSETDVTRWLDCCERLATCGWRSAESAEAFVRVSPFLLQRRSVAPLWQWAEHGEELARLSAASATSFFRAARPFVQQAPADALRQWVADGQWYLQQHPTFAALAETYFEISPTIYGQYPATDAQAWGQLGHDFARLGTQPARDFLSLSRHLAEQAPEVDLAPAWRQARRMLPPAGKLALEYLQHYPDYVERFGDAGAAVLRDVVDELLAPQAAHAEAFLHKLSSTLILLPTGECLQALTWCGEISAVSHAGCLAFLDHLSALRERLPDNRLHDWIRAGIDAARRHEPAGDGLLRTRIGNGARQSASVAETGRVRRSGAGAAAIHARHPGPPYGPADHSPPPWPSPSRGEGKCRRAAAEPASAWSRGRVARRL